MVTEVVDGDTMTVRGLGRVRLVGVDAPERGACGSDQATARLRGLVLGRAVSLVPDGRDDRDRYGRLLRYVEVGGVDAGRELIAAGLATARYDSRDGYGPHPRESAYVDLDARTPNYRCGTNPPAAAPTPSRTSAAPQPAGAQEPWNRPGPDLHCADIGRKVQVTGPDYHRLDADGDGWGCESYG